MKARLRAKQMPDLNHLTPAWARMSAEHARLAYAQSLEAVEILYQQFGEPYVRALIRDPEALAQTAARVSHSLASN